MKQEKIYEEIFLFNIENDSDQIIIKPPSMKKTKNIRLTTEYAKLNIKEILKNHHRIDPSVNLIEK